MRNSFGGLLRILTIATRGGMILLLGGVLNKEEFGFLNIIIAIVSYSMLVVGLDVYVVTTREMAQINPADKRKILRCHYIITICAFILLIPILLYFVDLYGLTDYKIILVLLVLTDYLNQDLYRMHVAIGNYRIAAVGLAVRSALWVWLLVGLYMLNGQNLDLEMVLDMWLLFSVIAIVYNAYTFYLSTDHSDQSSVYNTWLLYVKNFKIIIGYWTSTIAFKFTNVADKLLIPIIAGVGSVGPYGIAFSLANLGAVAYDALILDANYSKWSNTLNARNTTHSNKITLIKSEIKKSIFFGFAYGVLVLIALATAKFVLQDKPNFNIPYFIVLQATFFALLVIPHQAINFINYLSGNDRTVLLGNYVGFVIFVIVLMASYVHESYKLIGLAPVFSILLMSFVKLKGLEVIKNSND